MAFVCLVLGKHIIHDSIIIKNIIISLDSNASIIDINKFYKSVNEKGERV